MTDVAIVGAGPYGLSLAAHLRETGVGFRIFGKPMGVWRDHMPAGMLLKSDGFATDLYEPHGVFTLGQFCARQGIQYEDMGLPIALETFVSYGLAFQRQFVPNIDEREVASIGRRPNGGFLVQPTSGDAFAARRVVVAVGISYFQYVPPVFDGLPPHLLSHSSAHSDVSHFNGREVIVVGAGASALDTAALLHRAGSGVQLVARRRAIPFHSQMRHPRPFTERFRRPMTGIGAGWRSVFCTEAPLLFRMLPEDFRLEVVRRHLGPAPGWFTREQTEGRFPFVLGATPVTAAARNARVHLRVAMADGALRDLEADHIIAATGYKTDVRRVPFLTENLRKEIDSIDHSPRLSSNFESSVPGLYFVGLAAANCFGPTLRFAFGAKFAAPRLTRHLIRVTRA